jgi:tRNA(Ile)-lysidine synthase
MLDTFIKHIRVKTLLNPSKTYLLACSGGLDSICLGELLSQAAIPFEVAHVNFQLRGSESSGDEYFVREWAHSRHLIFHVKRANTMVFAKDAGISTQMAAREIRYTWFEKVCKERKLDGILLAHHKDDQIETVFLNLLRGTGIEGLYGMADRRGNLIRPLLPFSRKNLEEFASIHQLAWREDSSNVKLDYKRNKLRHSLLPEIFDFAPDAKINLQTSLTRLTDTGKAFTSLVEQWLKINIVEQNGIQSITIKALIAMQGTASIIYFWLRSYGFNSDQAQAIHNSLEQGVVGKLFGSAAYIVNVDRDFIYLAPISEKFKSIELSDQAIKFTIAEGNYELLKLISPVNLDQKKANAMLDLERLTFPLTVRTWEQGDRFIPLGMKSQKKISDFLIDLKIPLLRKQEIKVLISDQEIAWVIGHRIADWAKTTAATQKVLYLKKTDLC